MTKETADIVEQLRKSANTIYSQDGYTFRLGLHNEAADEIEKLREERSRLRAKLKPYEEANDRLKALYAALREEE